MDDYDTKLTGVGLRWRRTENTKTQKTAENKYEIKGQKTVFALCIQEEVGNTT